MAQSAAYPSLSVLFAVYNGAERLERVLEGYLACKPPPYSWELVAVDNGSRDASVSILERYRDRLPLNILSEPSPGKNRALNRGLKSVRGELVVLTDDDAVPDPDFLQAWAAMLTSHLNFDIIAGRVVPLFPAPPSPFLAQLEEHYPELFAINDRPAAQIPGDAVFGPNMAVRRKLFDAGARFDERIGPNWADKAYPMGSETEFCERMVREGAACWFEPTARVGHIVRPEQMTRSFVVSRAYRHGRGVAAMHDGVRMGLRRNLIARLARRLLWAIRAIDLGRRSMSPDASPSELWNHHWRRGYARELAGLKPVKPLIRAPRRDASPPARAGCPTA